MHHAHLYTGPDPAVLYSAALAEAAQQLMPTQKSPENHPDCHILDNGGAEIKIDQVRAWRQLAQRKPNEAERYVFILCAAQNMNLSAQNALLALLEEPPSPCVFYLLCDNGEMLLPTVRSRCQVRRFSGRPQGFPAEAEAWAETWVQRAGAGDELGLLTHALSAEKLGREQLRAYFEALLAAYFTPLTGAYNLFMIERVREARLALDGNVGGGHLLAALVSFAFAP